MKQILLMIAVVTLVGCGERSSNDVEALKAENEKLRAETEAARLKAENAQLKAALANNSATGVPTQTGDIKTCYWCKESIKAAAQICKNCGKNPSSPIEKAIRMAARKSTGKLTKADFDKVIKLNLSHNKLTDVKGLEKLTQLKELNLGFNQLTDVKGLEKLTQLEELKLYSNQLTSVEGLEKLPQLRVLYLSHNQLTDVPKGLEKLTQLTYLNLGGNQLPEVPKGLEKLTQLKSLYLRDNQLTDVKGLEKLTQLTYLNLIHYPNLTNLTKAQIDKLQKALPKCDIRSNPKK